MSLVYLRHESESLCEAHVALIMATNPHVNPSYGYDEKRGWHSFWNREYIGKGVDNEES